MVGGKKISSESEEFSRVLVRLSMRNEMKIKRENAKKEKITFTFIIDVLALKLGPTGNRGR